MKQLLCCSDSYTGSFNGLLQLPIRPNSILPLSVIYVLYVGLCIHAYMYVCINVCISLYMYVLCMYYACIMHTLLCVYVCMYANTNQIYNARNVTPKCESEARNHTYMQVCTQCILKIKLHFLIF